MATVTPPRSKHDHGTPGLLVVMTVAVLALTAAISAFAVVGQWWLLPVTMLALILATGVVAAVVGRALGDDR